jgi:hypothetical protein
MAAKELAPLLMQDQGLLRYTLFKVNDSRFGSTTLCNDRQPAENIIKRVAEWVQGTRATLGYRLGRTLQGERIYTYQGSDDRLKGGYGTMRIAQSPASVRDIKAAWEQNLELLCKEEPVFRDEHTDAYVNLGAYRSENIANRFLRRAIEGSQTQRYVAQQSRRQ